MTLVISRLQVVWTRLPSCLNLKLRIVLFVFVPCITLRFSALIAWSEESKSYGTIEFQAFKSARAQIITRMLVRIEFVVRKVAYEPTVALLSVIYIVLHLKIVCDLFARRLTVWWYLCGRAHLVQIDRLIVELLVETMEENLVWILRFRLIWLLFVYARVGAHLIRHNWWLRCFLRDCFPVDWLEERMCLYFICAVLATEAVALDFIRQPQQKICKVFWEPAFKR